MEKDYKQEIIQTRVGCLGSSDGNLIASVALNNYVPKSAYKRLAICKGLIPKGEDFTNAAMRMGDEVENQIYNHLKAKNDKYVSNPLWVSKKYSRENVKLISHPDLVLFDEKKKIIFIYEIKATKYDFSITRQRYRHQLYIHSILGKEIAESTGKGWKTKMYLVHYSTNGLNLDEHNDFDPSRISIHDVKFHALFDIGKAMDLIDIFLAGMTEYYDGDNVDANQLPDNVKEKFEKVTTALREIKRIEEEVNDFKEKLYSFMCEKDIKTISNDIFSITRVDSTESKTFDAKKFLSDYAQSHPRKIKQLREKYEKTTKKKGYALIKLKQ